MDKIYVGIDFHKNKTVLYTTNQHGEIIEGFARLKTISTKGLVKYFANHPSCEIAIEATGGVNPYVEKLRLQGHQVHIINPNKFRGIGISGKKTDERDAKALNTFIRLNPNSDCEVHLRSQFSRDVKSLIVAREMVMRSRINITNHLRGSLREQAITLPTGAENFWKLAPQAITEVENPLLKESFQLLYDQALKLHENEQNIYSKIVFLSQNNEEVKRLQTIPGIGLLTAMTMVAVVDDFKRFKDADKFSSYIGLVPRVFSSATTTKMGSITRSGSEILRRYLIHGARSWLKKKKDNSSVKAWALSVEHRRGTNKATVALARKISRIAFAIMRDGTVYKEQVLENNLSKVV